MISHGDRSRRQFIFVAACIVLFAWLLREQFILFTHVTVPIRGDAYQYYAYAWNLVHHQVFSLAAPKSVAVVPDAFRGPGYPLFLAGNLLIGGNQDSWYRLTLQLQALLGAATIALTMALGRHWLSRGATLTAGLLMAIWPHHIAATGAVLSEVLFGFLLTLALWLTGETTIRKQMTWAATAGLAFGMAYLVNPIVLLFPPLAAILLARAGQSRQAIVLALLPLLMAGAWALRAANLPEAPVQPGRATLNFVEGSWPQYHAAYNFKDIDPIALQISEQIGAEERLFARSPRRGLAAMAERMKQDPAYYARWYLLQKPWLLWDWNIRVGSGDVYFAQVRHSPLDVNPPLLAMKTTLRLLNPLIFLLAVAAAVPLLLKCLRRAPTNDPAQLSAAIVALFCVYVTLLHTVFQAEPRYSIPYRPFELLLTCTALAAILVWYRRRRSLA